MADFTIKQGDTKPTLSMTLYEGTAAVDLSGVISMNLVLTTRLDETVAVLVAAATVDSDPTSGRVSYLWQVGDTDVPGEYLGEWHCVFADGPRTFPTVGRFSVNIQARLPNALPGP